VGAQHLERRTVEGREAEGRDARQLGVRPAGDADDARHLDHVVDDREREQGDADAVARRRRVERDGPWSSVDHPPIPGDVEILRAAAHSGS
jgi:hypothetical protein